MEDRLNFRIAKLLLEINAIKLQPNNPFVWSSGIKSPIYCDNRILLSFPSYRNLVAKEIANLISQKYKSVDPSCISNATVNFVSAVESAPASHPK